MKQETDIMAKLVFNCGIQEKYEGWLPEHTIFIDNVSLELIDDSNVDYNANRPYQPSINIDQVGYRSDGQKIAVFRDVTDQTEFTVVNADTKKTVYTGKLENKKENKSAAETNWTGDFSSVTEEGKYFISCKGLDDSYTFKIGDKVYSELLDDSVRMLYLQRCGVKIDDEDFGHEACHTEKATIYGTNEKIDVSGGWHDAGDYGRYVVPAAKAVADLLYAYEAAPELYSDNIGIPESGNNIPDILDEVRFELEWMMKMQTAEGGAYHKVSCKNFPAYVMPTKETAELFVTPVSSTATADFCASMALAYEFYKGYDTDFAQKCMEAADKAWAWLEANPGFIFKNPEDIVTGEYGDKTDKDERYWAAVQMYRATGDEKYLANVKSAYMGLDWSTVGDYGNIAILTMKGADKGSEIYVNAKNAVIKQADSMLKNVESSPYGSSLTTYNWGSNMTIANAGIIFGLAESLSGNESYSAAAQKQLNYLLGTNPLGTCFVSAYGTVSPENPHHRPSMAVGHAMKGMLAGGVNENLEDSAAKAYCKYEPSAKCYIDNSESYSTNEITIYWNSPLTYLLSLTEKKGSVQQQEVTTTSSSTTTTSSESTTTVTAYPEVSLYGDANCDGGVDMADAVLIMQSIANPNKYGSSGSSDSHITAQGLANADVSEKGNGVTVGDARAIQSYLLGAIDVLPE
jgi:endoglucanase